MYKLVFFLPTEDRPFGEYKVYSKNMYLLTLEDDKDERVLVSSHEDEGEALKELGEYNLSLEQEIRRASMLNRHLIGQTGAWI